MPGSSAPEKRPPADAELSSQQLQQTQPHLSSSDGKMLPQQPSLPFRVASSITLGIVGAACRAAMFVGQKAEVHGLDGFLRLLDARKDPRTRTRGLITVSNHLSIIDDPFMWGALPFRYAFDADNMRWSLGSFDLCFRNRPLSTFFTLGQVLPTHRHRYSAHGGPFQATMTQAVRLLSDPSKALPLSPSTKSLTGVDSATPSSTTSLDISDPFTTAALTYSTNGIDSHPAPSAYASRKHAWIHVFPEGRIHQHPHYIMRYFRWGVARLILEADECPDVIPIWIEGCEQIMHEERTFPRFLPRFGKRVGIWFGDNVAGSNDDSVFAELRTRWQNLVHQELRRSGESLPLGELNAELEFGRAAVELRKECTLAVRRAVLDLRRSRGLPDEDPKASRVETWIEEGPGAGHMRDGSIVREE